LHGSRVPATRLLARLVVLDVGLQLRRLCISHQGETKW